MTGFYASFRAQHPIRDLSNLLTPLGVLPTHCWKAGDRRRTPRGEQLQGVYDFSYFCCALPLLANNDLAEWLRQAINFLRPVAKQLAAFVDDGGAISFYIGLEKGSFEGATFAPELMIEMGALRVSLEIDQSL